jgi:hypothetical protein
MHPNDPREKQSFPEEETENTYKEKTDDQQRSDPPLTEIKGVTEPEEYIEPEVEDEPGELGGEG